MISYPPRKIHLTKTEIENGIKLARSLGSELHRNDIVLILARIKNDEMVAEERDERKVKEAEVKREEDADYLIDRMVYRGLFEKAKPPIRKRK